MGYKFSPLSPSPYSNLYSPLTPSMSYRSYAPDGEKKRNMMILTVLLAVLGLSFTYFKYGKFTDTDLSTGKWKHLSPVIKFYRDSKFALPLIVLLLVGAGASGYHYYKATQE